MGSRYVLRIAHIVIVNEVIIARFQHNMSPLTSVRLLLPVAIQERAELFGLATLQRVRNLLSIIEVQRRL